MSIANSYTISKHTYFKLLIDFCPTGNRTLLSV